MVNGITQQFTFTMDIKTQNMTPKEKAEQLYKRFHHTCNCTIAGTSTIFIHIAKQCATICVDEVLQGKKVGYDKQYWLAVKTEIEKL